MIYVWCYLIVSANPVLFLDDFGQFGVEPSSESVWLQHRKKPGVPTLVLDAN